MIERSGASTCELRPARMPRAAPISVNGIVIPHEAIAQEAQHHPAGKPVAAWLAAARALVVRELLLQEARRIGMRSAPEHDGEGRRETDEEAAIRTLVEVEVTAPHADEETVRRYYESNRHRFRSPDLYEVRHILLAAEPSEVGGKEALAARAGALAEAVAHDADRFSELAVQWSACPSAKSGGKLGQIGPGQTVPEFEHGLAAMSEGATAIVETRYGLHVVRLDRRIEGQHLPFDIVRERIADWLDQKVRRTAIRQYIGLLAGRAEIKGIDLATIRSPLVQ